MQLAYELLPVWAGQDDKPPTAVPKVRHRSRVYPRRHSLERQASHACRTECGTRTDVFKSHDNTRGELWQGSHAVT